MLAASMSVFTGKKNTVSISLLSSTVGGQLQTTHLCGSEWASIEHTNWLNWLKRNLEDKVHFP